MAAWLQTGSSRSVLRRSTATLRTSVHVGSTGEPRRVITPQRLDLREWCAATFDSPPTIGYRSRSVPLRSLDLRIFVAARTAHPSPRAGGLTVFPVPSPTGLVTRITVWYIRAVVLAFWLFTAVSLSVTSRRSTRAAQARCSPYRIYSTCAHTAGSSLLQSLWSTETNVCTYHESIATP